MHWPLQPSPPLLPVPGLNRINNLCAFSGQLAFEIGMPEYFLLMVLALTIVVNLAGNL